ncbi:MAG: uracil-DNA glycosylase [Gammaproteobacteria bacterium]|uniref:uracil-DNA glycosylase n=1 Tax=Rhodoferax sp. TaxID=50421 RepID=UPI00181D222A|nr:uracil-DNA glycosylase [Rhodoferax sp.]MBU3897463.1 uracil-DNA glycosylase [Gammaproteobacteria bacterium]MBA3056916.1 uracil-DNA glycosylase [Rhodoferax sp.]MBU3998510.1 uracil-DNA glycosylase [Gammaproteobacteria bacterium]MBU4018809.1 uracil-DNA glycosylase [Gammaproteobacteria bacterium]MBU4079764.1 uracil-DNA glycosylase [Gammaproteobacteria bacterium]
MSLDLDTRQRTILQEMGLRIWLPAPVVADAMPDAAAAPLAARASPSAARITPAAPEKTIERVATNAVNTGVKAQFGLKNSTFSDVQATAARAGGIKAELAHLAWPELAQTIAACQACALCEGRRAAVLAPLDAPQRADWLVVSEPPDDVDEQAGAPLAGASGQLLDNMLKALGLSRHGGDAASPPTAKAARAATVAYLTPVVKCRPAQPRNPSLGELATCEQYLRREVALVQPKVILALGRFAAQSLLQGSVPDLAGVPLGQLRGQSYQYQGVPVIVSYPPSYLLRSPQNKAMAWVDWCRAQAVLRGGG